MNNDLSPKPNDPSDPEATNRQEEHNLIRLGIDLLNTLLNTRDFNSPVIQHHLSPRI
ncbi:hypothetical protein B0A55_07228 [Friedmanniomyces simplex]|uniref:Uncharacterized protein n=1 Tax=Friedmanniomyces simplex TaxID=329884 RepID=A0A4U0X5Q7_9PEZI|nr:hypothetical protein B0A55_07228 [Friedmanniomyces simplex]